MEETLKEFWMVWNPKKCSPTKKHYNRNEAFSEARRLAKIESGGGDKRDIYILHTIAAVRTEAVYSECLTNFSNLKEEL